MKRVMKMRKTMRKLMRKMTMMKKKTKKIIARGRKQSRVLVAKNASPRPRLENYGTKR